MKESMPAAVPRLSPLREQTTVAASARRIYGQVLRFRPGSRDPQSVQWPGPADAGRVLLQIAPSSGSGYQFKGPWALFHLLDRVRVEPGGAPNRASWLFDVEGRKARFEVRSPAGGSPMLREELEQFQCPRRL